MATDATIAMFGMRRYTTPHAPTTLLAVDRDDPSRSLVDDATRTRIAATREALEHGRMRAVSGAAFPHAGVNGELALRRFSSDADTAVLGLLKHPWQGGIQERFATEVGAAMSIEHLMPVIARRRGGVAAMELRPGRTFNDAFIINADRLEHVLRAGAANRFPDATTSHVRRIARVERQLAQSFDASISNGDRNKWNGLADATEGATLLDHELLDRRNPGRGNVPIVRREFRDGVGSAVIGRVHRDLVVRTSLDGDTVEILRATDRDRISNAFDVLQADQARATTVGRYARRSSPAFLQQLFGRLDDMVDLAAVIVRAR